MTKPSWVRACNRRLKRERGEGAGEGMYAMQHAQGTLMVVLELTGGNGGHGQHLTVTRVRTEVRAMVEGGHHIINDGEDRDNERVVHGYLHASTRV